MLASKQTILGIENELAGKRVLMRVDFNVPIKNGAVDDATRIIATIPTIKYLLDKGVSGLILASHCGRPDGKYVSKFSLSPVVPVINNLLQNDIVFLPDCVGEEVEKKCSGLEGGKIVLLENLRFHAEEEGSGKDSEGNKVKCPKEDVDKFRSSLTRLCDIYVNDAFGAAHRAHSSIVGVTVPLRVAGLLMKKELDFFSHALETPDAPFVAILGGAKVSDKIQLISSLLNRVNCMIIGGGMAFTFKKVLNSMAIGKSLFDEAGSRIVQKIADEAKEKGVKLLLPTDFVCGDSFSDSAKVIKCTDKDGIPDGYIGMDCGDESIQAAKEEILKAKTILWNGPVGVFEFSNFANGSLKFADYIAESTKCGSVSIIGGGDTASLIAKAGKTDLVSHVSTGGGASLELLEGKVLPGVDALSNKA